MNSNRRIGSRSQLDLSTLTLTDEPDSYDDPTPSNPTKKEGSHLKGRRKKDKSDVDIAANNAVENKRRTSSTYEPGPDDPPLEPSRPFRRKSKSSTSGSGSRVGFVANVTRLDESGKAEDAVILTEKNKHPKPRTGFLRRPTGEYRAAKEGKPIYPGER